MTRWYIASGCCGSIDLSMSRSSKGFADFFPTAPSVLQQKKSRTAQERKRQDSSGSSHLAGPSHTRDRADQTHIDARKVDRGHGALVNGTIRDQSAPQAAPLTQDESESVAGDLLNGVGSASSTSTASSVFDASGRQQEAVQQKRILQTELTPLTSIDSSSPGRTHSPAYVKQETSSIAHNPHSQNTTSTAAQPPTSMPAKPDFTGMGGVRPGKSISKGSKITYDPELDKTISSKERRSRQPVYKEIVSDVGCLSFHSPQS